MPCGVWRVSCGNRSLSEGDSGRGVKWILSKGCTSVPESNSGGFKARPLDLSVSQGLVPFDPLQWLRSLNCLLAKYELLPLFQQCSQRSDKGTTNAQNLYFLFNDSTMFRKGQTNARHMSINARHRFNKGERRFESNVKFKETRHNRFEQRRISLNNVRRMLRNTRSDNVRHMSDKV